MKVVRWSYEGLHIPMMEDSNGDLWVTPRVLAGALDVPENTIRKIRSRHADEMTSEGVTDSHTLEFLRKHKVEFGFGRSVQKTTVIISQLDMLIIAQLSKSETSKEFRKKFANFMIENGRRDYVHKDEYNRLALDRNNMALQLGEMSARLDRLERIQGLTETPQKVQLRIVQ